MQKWAYDRNSKTAPISRFLCDFIVEAAKIETKVSLCRKGWLARWRGHTIEARQRPVGHGANLTLFLDGVSVGEAVNNERDANGILPHPNLAGAVIAFLQAEYDRQENKAFAIRHQRELELQRARDQKDRTRRERRLERLAATL